MAYEDDIRRVADHLAHLISTPGPVAASELPLVNGARVAVRRLCEQILDDLEPDNPHRGAALTRLTEPALQTLRALLDDVPAALADDTAASLGSAAEPQTVYGARWRELTRCALIAAHEWSLIYPHARPTGREAWSIVTDVAAIAEALALAELDLQAQLDPTHDQATGRESHDLAFVAEHVRRLGPPEAPRPAAPLPSRRQHLLLRVRSLADAPAAAGRLVLLLHAAQRLRPESVRALARGHAENLLRMARILEQDRRPDRRSAALITGLRTHASNLETLAGEARSYRALERDDPRPMQQLGLLRDQWKKSAPAGGATRSIVLASLPSALAISMALRDAIEQQVDNGHWYVRIGKGRHPWERTNASTEPPIVDVARQTAAQAESLRRQTPAVPSRSAVQPPENVLSPHLQARAAQAQQR